MGAGDVLLAALTQPLRRLLADMVNLARLRLALFEAELELEKRRLTRGLLLGGLALVMVHAGLLLLSGFIVVALWDTHRLLALGAVAAVFLLGGLGLLLAARRQLHNEQGMFAGSVAQLRRDRAGLAQGRSAA